MTSQEYFTRLRIKYRYIKRLSFKIEHLDRNDKARYMDPLDTAFVPGGFNHDYRKMRNMTIRELD